MIEPNEALTAIGQLPDCEIDLADAALQLARARSPQADWQRAASHLSDLAREAASIGNVFIDRSLEVRLGALTGLLHARHGYEGDAESYDDLANADLIGVTERRRGLPVALGIVWLHCIRAAGWQGTGIDFPRHFLVRLDGPAHERSTPRLLVDVFAGGHAVTTDALLAMARRRATDEARIGPDLLRPMGNREVLLRLERNIVERRRAAGEWEDMLAALERMAAIAPEKVSILGDQASVLERLGRLRAAIACLQRLVALEPTGVAAGRARDEIDAMRRRLA